MIEVLYKKPGETPQRLTIYNDLHTLQEMVGGYIETFTRGNYVVICNEEWHMLNQKYCCTLFRNPFVGPVILCRYKDAEFESLTEDDFSVFPILMEVL